MIDTDLAQRLTAATEEGALAEQIADVVNPLLAKRDQLLALRNETKGRIAALDAQVVLIDRVLKAAGQKQQGAKKKSAAAPKPSPASIEKAVRYLAGSDKPLMTQEVASALKVEPSSMQKQLKTARDLELVRITGRGGSTGRALLYGVLPNAIERIEAGDVKWP